MSRIPAQTITRLGAAGVAGFVVAACAMNERTTAFRFQEATIASAHCALAAGELTCVQLIRLCLDRIEAYDRKGPALRSIITVNPKAMELAGEMDRIYTYDPNPFTQQEDGRYPT